MRQAPFSIFCLQWRHCARPEGSRSAPVTARDARVLDALPGRGASSRSLIGHRLFAAAASASRNGSGRFIAPHSRCDQLERLALGEGIGQALPEAQLARADLLAAAAALGAARRRGLDHVGHGYSRRRSTKHFR